ncbi:MAG: hypothetical protein ACPG69_07000, partial [Candidatus Pseudothioglobus sp.]
NNTEQVDSGSIGVSYSFGDFYLGASYLDQQLDVDDERDKIYELYALQVSSAIFGISIVATLVLLGWFNLTIISGLIAITFS